MISNGQLAGVGRTLASLLSCGWVVDSRGSTIAWFTSFLWVTSQAMVGRLFGRRRQELPPARSANELTWSATLRFGEAPFTIVTMLDLAASENLCLCGGFLLMEARDLRSNLIA